MGDRCYVNVTCRAVDAHLFEELGMSIENEDVNYQHCVELADEEMNYGLSEDDAPKGIPFIGFSGSGGSYGDAEFVSDGTDFVLVDCIHGCGPSVAVNSDGNPDPASLEHVRGYYATVKRAAEMLKDTQPPPDPHYTPAQAKSLTSASL